MKKIWTFLKLNKGFLKYVLGLLLILFFINLINLGQIKILISEILIILSITFLFLEILFISQPPQESITENQIKKIIDAMEDGVIIYDDNFTISYFNQAAENIFNIKKEKILGEQINVQKATESQLQRLVQVIFPSLAPLFILRSEVNKEPTVADIFFYEPDLFLRVLTLKIVSPAQPTTFIKIIHNRTKEISLLKSKDEFIAIASHQLRTPLNEIRWLVESMISDSEITSKHKEMLDLILKSIKKLNNLVDNLLDISKIEAGRFGYNFQKTNLIDFIKEILADIEMQIKKYNLELHLSTDQNIPDVYIDREKIKMAIFNLLDNAVKYNVPNGRIAIKIQKSDELNFLEVSVQDTGVGMTAEEVKNLFNKFFRTTTSQKINSEGSGLGLYITKNIILAHGGKIWAESEPGRGTKITFTLPVLKDLIPTKEVPILDLET